MLNSGSELIVQKKVPSWEEALIFLQSWFPPRSTEQSWNRGLFTSHLWSASLIAAALWGTWARSGPSLCSVRNGLAERKRTLEMLLWERFRIHFYLFAKLKGDFVWIPVQELCIKTRRDFLLDLTAETHSHVVPRFATALCWRVEVTVSWTIVLPASSSNTGKGWKQSICRNTTLLVLFYCWISCH